MRALILLVSMMALYISSLAQVPTKMATDDGAKVFASKSTSRPPVVRLPKLDINSSINEDEEERNRGLGYPPRFGKDIDVNYSLSNSGMWEEIENGNLWKLEISSDGALSLNMIFFTTSVAFLTLNTF